MQLLEVLEIPQNYLPTIANRSSYFAGLAVDGHMVGAERVGAGKVVDLGVLRRANLPQLDVGVAADSDDVL